MIHCYICSGWSLWVEGWEMIHKTIFYCFATAQVAKFCTPQTIICICGADSGNKLFLNIRLTINNSFTKFKMSRVFFGQRAVDYGNHVSEKILSFSSSSAVCMSWLQPVAFYCCRFHVLVIVVMVFQTDCLIHKQCQCSLLCLCTFTIQCMHYDSAQFNY